MSPARLLFFVLTCLFLSLIFYTLVSPLNSVPRNSLELFLQPVTMTFIAALLTLSCLADTLVTTALSTAVTLFFCNLALTMDLPDHKEVSTCTYTSFNISAVSMDCRTFMQLILLSGFFVWRPSSASTPSAVMIQSTGTYSLLWTWKPKVSPW